MTFRREIRYIENLFYREFVISGVRYIGVIVLTEIHFIGSSINLVYRSIPRFISNFSHSKIQNEARDTSVD